NDITISENLDVGNNAYVRNGLNVGPGGINSNGVLSINSSLSSYFAGRVGIGTTSPDSRLQVTGGGLCVGSDANCNSDNNTEGVVYSSSTSMTVYDVAENYPTKESNLKPGEIVSADNTNEVFVKRSKGVVGEDLIGVITTNPAVLMGGFNGNQFPNEQQAAVALVGRVPVIVSSISGDFEVGDYIVSSVLPGVGVKAKKGAETLGKALNNTTDWNTSTCPVVSSIDSIVWPEDDGSNPAKPCFRVPVSSLDAVTRANVIAEYGLTAGDYFYVGKIMVFVNVSWYQPYTFTNDLNSLVADYKAGVLGGAPIVSTPLLTLDVGEGSFTVDELGNVSMDGDLEISGSIKGKSGSGLKVLLNSELLESFTIFNELDKKIFSIDSEGFVRINVLGLTKTDNESVGTGTVLAGEQSVTIASAIVNADSVILITFKDDYSPATRHWISEIIDETSFTLQLNTAVAMDSDFTYWIVPVSDEVEEEIIP
ncbi:hypothetical protein JW962_00255, partial [Candidatus Dojkabacteria bacterium]|nr:hypothetical protein [Candidatus Dojkabacteria bacterium]